MTDAERDAWNVQHERERLERIALAKIARSEELLVLIRKRYRDEERTGLLVDLVTELEGCIAFNHGLLHLEAAR